MPIENKCVYFLHVNCVSVCRLHTVSPTLEYMPFIKSNRLIYRPAISTEHTEQ